MRVRSVISQFAVAMSLFATAACVRSSASAPAGAASVAPAEPVSDANIAAIVVAANTADISYAQLALARAADTAVKTFANTMINDHNSVNRQAVALATRLVLTPIDNTISLDLRDNAEAERDKLRELEGRDFDKEYITNEVAYHEKVLGAIDNVLIPNAKNADLRALLIAVRPAVAHHLEMARGIKGTMKK
jgi:putative membrane protein